MCQANTQKCRSCKVLDSFQILHPMKHNQILITLPNFLLNSYLSFPSNSLSPSIWNPKYLSQPSNAHLSQLMPTYIHFQTPTQVNMLCLAWGYHHWLYHLWKQCWKFQHNYFCYSSRLNVHHIYLLLWRNILGHWRTYSWETVRYLDLSEEEKRKWVAKMRLEKLSESHWNASDYIVRLINTLAPWIMTKETSSYKN